MKIEEMVKVDYTNRRVLTTKQLAELYNCPVGRIKENFSRAREYFKEGVHYFKLTGAALREFKRTVKKVYHANDSAEWVSTFTSVLYLWTYQGAARHCKMINTKEAWEVFDRLEKFYFECKGASTLPAPAEGFDELKEELERMKKQISTGKSLVAAVVYMLLLSNGLVKIGMTSNLTERMARLQAETGLEILDYQSTPFMTRDEAAALEKTLHERFAAQNFGGEYFDIRFRDAVKLLTCSPLPIQGACIA